MRRPTWYEIEPEQFGTGEWQSIIDVTRSSYERSMTGKAVRAVEDERGIGINEGPRKAAR
jgi:hypothetical protein